MFAIDRAVFWLAPAMLAGCLLHASVAPAALLASISHSDPAPLDGGNETFTTVITSDALGATGVVVNELLPFGLNFVSMNASQGSYDANTGVWNVGSLSPAGSATLELNTLVAALGPLTLTATAMDDSNSAVSTSDTITALANLQPSVTVMNAMPVVGTADIFTTVITNLGSSTVSNILVNELLPFGLAFVSTDFSQGNYDPNTGVWNIGSLAGGGSALLQITALVELLGPSTLTATVSEDGGFARSAAVTLDAVSAPTVLPEPATLGLTGLAIAGLGFMRRKRSLRANLAAH